MKIAVSSNGKDLNAMVDARFGRCPYFIIAEIEGNEIKGFEVIENQSASAFRGAGIQAAQTVANKGVEAVITGNMGPNAFSVLSQTGIKIFFVFGITVKDAIEKYLKGELSEIKQPGFGAGRGFGRGMGRGRGF